jgi:hypothetical protein
MLRKERISTVQIKPKVMIPNLHSTQWFFIISNTCIKLNAVPIRSTEELVVRNSDFFGLVSQEH